MLIKVKKYFYDKNDPSRVFDVGEFVQVNDPERAKTIVAQGLGDEVKEAEDYKILDPVSKAREPEADLIPDEPKRGRRAKK